MSSHQSVSKRRSASGGRRPSWILKKKKLQRNVLQLRSRTHVDAYVDRHRHQDRCQCHQEPDRDGSHYPQRQPSGETDRLIVAGPASCRTTPTPTWNVSRDKILVWWWRHAHRFTPPPPMGVCPSTCTPPPQSKFLRRGLGTDSCEWITVARAAQDVSQTFLMATRQRLDRVCCNLKVVCHLPTNSHYIFPRIGSHYFHLWTQSKCCPDLK